MRHQCPICSQPSDLADGSLLAYAGQPHLVTRLSQVLGAAKRSHHSKDGMVVIHASDPAERREIVELLDHGLTTVEKRLTRIGGAQLSQMFGAPDLVTFVEIVRSEWFDLALERDRFTIYYQPIIDLSSGKAVAFECLIRLEGDRIYSGGEIVNAASLRGDIVGFDRYAREKAIRLASDQQKRGVQLFINFFPSAMFDPKPCLASTLEAIRAAGIDPSEIVFEILECDPYTDAGHTRRICEYLRERGFRYAIDDLGSGANSLDLIQTLRPDYVKVDKSILWNLEDPFKREMLRRAVALAGEVGAEVIAEGIETPEQAIEARKFGVRLMQGYCFGKPAPVMRECADKEVLRDLIRLAGAVTSSSAAVRERVLVPAFSSRSSRTRP